MGLPIAIPLIAAGIKGIGSVLKGAGKNKQEKAQAAEQDAANRRLWSQQELARIAKLKNLQAVAGARGLPLTVQPDELVERPYGGAVGSNYVGKGNTLGLVGGALSGIGDIGLSAAQAAEMKDKLGGAGLPGEVAGPPGSQIVGGGVPWSAGQPVGGPSSAFIDDLIAQLLEQQKYPVPMQQPRG